MSNPRASVFWQSAVKSGLIDEPTLESCYQAIPLDKRAPDSIDRRLARQVVNAGHVTLWQAQQMLAGRYQGLRIDRYVLRDLIGQGGMGRVYLAYDTRLKRPVALKILSRERMSNPRALARFRREILVGAQLQHENLVRIYDDGEYHGVNYLVMEHINGQTIAQMIADSGRLPVELAAELGRQIALGLDHLHQKGLLHRDVNPMNVLVDHDGTAKITDLGLAIDPNDESEEVVTRDGATVGTFDYISPEQARHSRKVDSRSDIYSLGCSLYHMLAGHVPFPAPSLPEKLFAHQSGEPDPLPTEVPEGLVAVVRRMMSKRPQDRYARPRDAARALEPFAKAPTRAVGEAAESATSPAGQAVRSEASTVIDNGPPPAPKAPRPLDSDPDLAVHPAPAAVAVAEKPGPGGSPSSDAEPEAAGATVPSTSDPFHIDLGPPPTLTEGLSVSRSRDDDEPRPTPWLRLAVPAGALAVLIAIAYLLGWFGGPSGPAGRAAPGKIAKAEPPPVPRADVTVEYDDGTFYEAKDLREAIQMAVGKPAAVVLRNARPLTIEVDDPILVPFGALTIRAAPDTSPTIAVVFRKPASFLRVDPYAKLRLSGVTIRVSAPAKGNRVPTLIESYGPVELTNLGVIASDDARSALVLDTQGKETRLSGCWVEGFDDPIRLAMPEGGSARFLQCMFVRTGVADASKGWAATAVPLGVGGHPRTLEFDRCTVVGGLLLHIPQRFDDRTPLELAVRASVLSTRALLMWAGAFPGGLRYNGQDNLYEITGSAWVIQPPDGLNPVPNGPANLQAWASQPSVKDAGARVLDVRFRQEQPGTSESAPANYSLLNVDPPKPGADPDKVGPHAGRGETGG